jgi:hypothetical protein
MPGLGEMGQALKLLNSAEGKKMIQKGKLIFAVLPDFKADIITMEDDDGEVVEYTAFYCKASPESIRRVEKFKSVFTDLLQPFEIRDSLELDGEVYAAVLFPKEKPKDGTDEQ